MECKVECFLYLDIMNYFHTVLLSLALPPSLFQKRKWNFKNEPRMMRDGGVILNLQGLFKFTRKQIQTHIYSNLHQLDAGKCCLFLSIF